MEYGEGGSLLKYAPKSVASVTIPSKVKKIYGVSENDYAFQGCASTLESFSFEGASQLETIGNYSFYKCVVLNIIDLRVCSKLSSIESYAFSECVSVTEIHFPQSLLLIGQNSFTSTKITSLSIPASVTTLEGAAFYNSAQLSRIDIPVESKLTKLDYGTFRKSIITTFFIPRNIEHFSPACLEDTLQLKSITVDGQNKFFKTEKDVLMNINGTKIFKYPTCKGTSYEVPHGVVELDFASFNCVTLESVSLPDTLTTIVGYCFINSKLKSIAIPDSVTSIGNNAFAGCNQLSSVQLTNKTTLLPKECFFSCNLQTITIPEGITSIGSGCFKNNANLGVVILPSTLKDLGGGAFFNCPKVKPQFSEESDLYIDDQYLIMDKSNTSIKQFIGNQESVTIKIPATVKTIELDAFANKKNLVAVDLTGSILERISTKAFEGCTNLEAFSFPSTLISIGEYAFGECKKLQSISFSNSFTTILQYAFQKCTALEEVLLENSKVEKIEEGCFKECSALTSVSFPGTLTEIGEKSFQSCTLLDSVFITPSVTKINAYAFQYSGLTSVTFSTGSKMTELHLRCFSGCSSLSSFVYPENVSIIGNYAFEGCAFTSIVLPNSIVEIQKGAYSSNEKLVNFTIQEESNLTEIGTSVFEYDYMLNSFYCNSSAFTVETGALLNQDRSRIIAFPPSSEIYYLQIPPYVTHIGDSAFSNCKNLRTVSIADQSVTEICLRAFTNCTNLRFINLPNCITAIGKDAFKGCISLTCGIPIDLTPELVSNLVSNAGMPRNCLYDCKYCYTKEFLRREQFNGFKYALVCLILSL